MKKLRYLLGRPKGYPKGAPIGLHLPTGNGGAAAPDDPTIRYIQSGYFGEDYFGTDYR